MRNETKRLRIIIGLALLLVAGPVCGQKSFKLKDYMPGAVGDEWRYKNLAPDGLSPIIIRFSARRKFNGAEVWQRDENNGDYRLQSMNGSGLWLYQLYFKGERTVTYPQPVLLMPAKLSPGHTYRSETGYETHVKGELKERGTQSYEVTSERVADTETYQNCLVIRTKAIRVDEAKTQKGYELVEWYAKGVGAVKVTGELWWTNAQGERLRTFKVDAVLEKTNRKS